MEVLGCIAFPEKYSCAFPGREHVPQYLKTMRKGKENGIPKPTSKLTATGKY